MPDVPDFLLAQLFTAQRVIEQGDQHRAIAFAPKR